MKSRDYLTFAAVLLLISAVLSGCFADNFKEYDGPARIGFAAPGAEATPFEGTVVDGSGPYTLTASLILADGTHETSHQFPYETVDSLTTAEAGVHYELPTEPLLTVPADTLFGSFTVNVLEGNIPPGEEVTLAIKLQESLNEEIIPAVNFDTFVLTIIGKQADAVGGPDGHGGGTSVLPLP